MFGNFFRRARMLRGKTQQAVADAIGVGLRSCQMYEQGIREPPLQKLVSLAECLHVSLDYLLGRVSDPEGSAGEP